MRQQLSLVVASVRIKVLEVQTGLSLLYREARGDLQEYSGDLRGHVRVPANTTAVTDFLPEILPGFLSANPRVNIDLREKPNPEIARGVLDGSADIGIVAGPVDTLGLQAIHFSTDRLMLVTSRRHRFARRRRIAFAETLDEDAVGMQQGSTLQTFLAQITDKLGKPLKLRIQLSSFDAMCRMIGAGVGVGIVPESAARRNQGSMKLALIELTDAWSVRERYILVREREALPAYAQSLVDAICAHYQGPAPALQT